MPWRVLFDHEVTWRDWVAAISASSGRKCTVKSVGPLAERRWRIKVPGVSGDIRVRDRGGNAWDIDTFWSGAGSYAGSAVRALGGTDVDLRTLARETPGVIDYVTGWWGDGLGSITLTREPGGERAQIRVLVCFARSWFIDGGESERVFDDGLSADRGRVDVPKLLAELGAFEPGQRTGYPGFHELVEWLESARTDGAHVDFVRSS